MDSSKRCRGVESFSVILKDTPKIEKKYASKLGERLYKHNFPDSNKVKENIRHEPEPNYSSINQRYLSSNKQGKTYTTTIDLTNKENISRYLNSANISTRSNNINPELNIKEVQTDLQNAKKNTNSRPISKTKSIKKPLFSSELHTKRKPVALNSNFKMSSESELGYYTAV